MSIADTVGCVLIALLIRDVAMWLGDKAGAAAARRIIRKLDATK